MTARDALEFLSAHLPSGQAERLAEHVVHLPDPAGALRAIERLSEAGSLPGDPVRLHALTTLAGCSPYLAGLLLQHPDTLETVGSSDPGHSLPTREDLEQELARFQFRHSSLDPPLVLRRFKQRATLRIAHADLLRTARLAEVTGALSLLADVLLEKAVRTARAPLQARHGRPIYRNDQGEVTEAEFVVLGLGKLGGGELNYSSDIDILYLFERDGETEGTGHEARGSISNREYFLRLAAEVTRLIGAREPEGEVFRVDLNLRPGGHDGDLAHSVGAAVAYYGSWSAPWERQALIKARPVAGNLDLGRRFIAAVEPLVYPQVADPFIAVEIGAMKDRIDAQLSLQGHSDRDLKLGRGGIREIEFAVQALQLKRGGADPWLRQGHTLLALHRLAERGLIGYAEYAALAEAYGVLRDLEHRLQLIENRQTALLPSDPTAWGRLARTLWLVAPPRDDEGRALAEALERHRAVVRSFYDSVIGRGAQIAIAEDTTDLLLDRLDEAALLERLRQSGLPGPESLLRPVQALRRLLQPARLTPDLSLALRRSTPVLLRAALMSSNPRRALGHLETLFSTLMAYPASLRRFLDHRDLLTPTIRVLGRSDLLAGLLVRQPAILRTLEDRARLLRAPDPGEQREVMLSACRSAPDPRRRAGALRRRHREELALIALRDINRQTTVHETVKSLSSLADATIEAVLDLARAEAGGPEGGADEPRVAVLGLGRLGYRELDYGSDLDLVFVCDPPEGDAAEGRARASRLCEAVVRILSTLSRDGQLYRVDLRLRPSGSKGDLVLSPAALRAYFSGAADVWEWQSFLKARTVAGDRALGESARSGAEAALFERASALPPGELQASVRDMRRRLEEAVSGGGDGRRLKHGPGGLADIDFIIEYLQLGRSVASPPEKDTLRLLTHLHDRGMLEDAALRDLYEGYLSLRSIDHAIRLIQGRPLVSLPSDPARLDELGRALLPEDEGDDPASWLVHQFDAKTAAVRRVFDDLI